MSSGIHTVHTSLSGASLEITAPIRADGEIDSDVLFNWLEFHRLLWMLTPPYDDEKLSCPWSLPRHWFTFSTWPKICRALGRDPIAELARGRAELRRAKDQDRAKAYLFMLERSQADTLVAFWRRLPPEEQRRVVRLLSGEEL